MSDCAFKGDKRRSSGKPAGRKLFMILNVCGELLSEETVRGYYLVRVAQSLKEKITQTTAHRIADEQRSREHRHSNRDPGNHGQIGAPEISEVPLKELRRLSSEFPELLIDHLVAEGKS